MTYQERRAAENILYCYAAGQVNAAWVKRELADKGLAADLRSWRANCIDVEIIQTGEMEEIAI